MGSSHASRFRVHLEQLSKKFKFDLKVIAKPGAVYNQLVFPDPSELCESDILILLPFGNNLFEKKSFRIENSRKGRIIHISDYKPTPESEIKRLFINLQQKLKKYTCRVFILDSFFKYVNCCEQHVAAFPLTLKHQRKCNRLLKEHFATLSERYTVLNHIKLFDKPRTAKCCVSYYKERMVDSVHFTSDTYKIMAAELIKTVIDK